jgi:hypothetical protein
MPTVMNPRHHHVDIYRTGPQKVCIALGIVFLLIGFAGMVLPGIMGMHLSMSHNMIHIFSGAAAMWAGYSEHTNRAFNFCVGFGALYGFLGIIGFIIGSPGYPGVGHMEADQNLFRVIPNVLEFGTMDHIVHILLSAIFLFTAYTWRKDRKGVVHKSTRTTLDADVNRVDINKRGTLGSSEKLHQGKRL